MRVAIYARVSTTRQAETDLSIPDQIAQVEGYAKRHGYLVVNTYVEPGASATDDKRPAFQQMLADAQSEPRPFDAIIVHSYSRFFRDAFELEFNVRRLRKREIKLIAITQDFGDDPMAEMIRKIVAVFDEHSSKENGKHTKRAMKENARRGFHNGRPPFGYRHVATGEIGNKGREKKRLDIEPSEAAVIRRIFDLYIDGLNGHELGMSSIAQYLNSRGMQRRGKPWRIQTVDLALSSPIYRGEYVFNQRSGKDRKRNPEDEIVRSQVPAIVDQRTYDFAAVRRRARRPSAAPARRLTSARLLSGMLTCGCCGAGMVISSGTSKGGKVHSYYTCQTKLSRGSSACPSKRLPVTPLETLVLTAFAERVLSPDRLKAILTELEKLQAHGSMDEQARLRELQARLKEKDEALTNLMEAIERKVLPLDETTRQRAQLHQNARSEILLEIGRLRAAQAPRPNAKSPRHIEAFSQAVKNRLFDRESGFARRYLGSLVTSITVGPEEVVLRGSKHVLAAAICADKLGRENVHTAMPVGHRYGNRHDVNERENLHARCNAERGDGGRAKGRHHGRDDAAGDGADKLSGRGGQGDMQQSGPRLDKPLPAETQRRQGVHAALDDDGKGDNQKQPRHVAGPRRAFDAHGRHRSPAKNEDGVQHRIHDRRARHKRAGRTRIAMGTNDAGADLRNDLEQRTEIPDLHVIVNQGQHRLFGAQQAEQRVDGKITDDRDERGDQCGKHDTVGSEGADRSLISLAHRPGDHRHNARPEADGQRNDEHDHRKTEGQRCQLLGAKLGDKVGIGQCADQRCYDTKRHEARKFQ